MINNWSENAFYITKYFSYIRYHNRDDKRQKIEKFSIKNSDYTFSFLSRYKHLKNMKLKNTIYKNIIYLPFTATHSRFF